MIETGNAQNTRIKFLTCFGKQTTGKTIVTRFKKSNQKKRIVRLLFSPRGVAATKHLYFIPS